MTIIGERINATRKRISRAIRSRARDVIREEIEIQDQAGAHYIDLNAGTGSTDPDVEAEGMTWLIDVALESTEKRLSIDSADPTVIQAAAAHLADRRPWMINSIKNEAGLLDALLPLAARHQVPAIALAMDGDGIPEGVDQRIASCGEIRKAASAAGVSADQLYFDPLVMPLASDIAHGSTALECLRGLKRAFPDAKTAMGISNISFGLMARPVVDAAFLTAAAASGLDAAICDPVKDGLRKAALLGDLLAGRDRHCRRYTRAMRREQGVADS
jgi:5-methyltetrahydrofolate--homocysteine methyltransferase